MLTGGWWMGLVDEIEIGWSLSRLLDRYADGRRGDEAFDLKSNKNRLGLLCTEAI